MYKEYNSQLLLSSVTWKNALKNPKDNLGSASWNLLNITSLQIELWFCNYISFREQFTWKDEIAFNHTFIK